MSGTSQQAAIKRYNNKNLLKALITFTKKRDSNGPPTLRILFINMPPQQPPLPQTKSEAATFKLCQRFWHSSMSRVNRKEPLWANIHKGMQKFINVQTHTLKHMNTCRMLCKNVKLWKKLRLYSSEDSGKVYQSCLTAQ